MNPAKLQEISHIAAQASAVALSKLVRAPVSIRILEVEDKNFREAFRMLEQETLVVVTHSLIVDETERYVKLILPKDTAFLLSDLLLKQERGATKELTKEVREVLEELSNIITGNYLRILASLVGSRDMLHQVGRVSWGTLESVQGQILSFRGPLSKKGNMTAISFDFQEAAARGYMMILLDADDLEER